MGKTFYTLALAVMVAACTHIKPTDPPSQDGIPYGPGLFTGAKGEWVITPTDFEESKREGTDTVSKPVESTDRTRAGHSLDYEASR